MARQSIPLDDLSVRPLNLWAKQWLLLTCGDFADGRFNTMTVGWGSLGTIWGMPFAQVLVRPTRHTFRYTERYDSFTLCAFAEAYREDLQTLGTLSGRDGSKIDRTRLTPIASTHVRSPSFVEAELVFECRKMYWDDLEPSHFLTPDIALNYPEEDFHRVYFGEILAVYAEPSFQTGAEANRDP